MNIKVSFDATDRVWVLRAGPWWRPVAAASGATLAVAAQQLEVKLGLHGRVQIAGRRLEAHTNRAFRLVPLLFLLLPTSASAYDQCRDSAGKFTARPETPVNIGDPDPVPEPAPTPTPAPSPEPERRLQIRAYGGALTAVTTDADAAVEPLGSLQVLAPLTTSKKGPSLFVKVDLTALPGETLSFSDVQTFKAIEAGIGIVQPLGGPLLFNLYLEGGFASRLAVESEPVDRLPGFWSAGFLFATSDGDHFLKVGLGPDERLSGEWSPCVHVSGQAKLGDKGGIGLYLVGSMIRALDLSGYGYSTPSRDSIRVGVALGN